MSDTPRPLSILIAALGGEGGGVLTNWIVSAAGQSGCPVQSTSIPGVAQRTGATTYYVEILPISAHELNGRQPILALTPGVGDIDIVLASELLEAGRCVAGGFVTPERTTVLASTSRFFAMDEKIAMGDGRIDPDRLTEAITGHARAAVLIDMDALAKQSGALISAVMLGVLAGSGTLPIPAETFETAIRSDGKAVDGNLRGFRAGLDAARGQTKNAAPDPKRRNATASIQDLEREIERTVPVAAQDIVREGVRRLASYQSASYARLYLDRLAIVREADERAKANGRLLRETARHLAVRMSFEDVVRVAAAKIAPERMARIAHDELRAGRNEPILVHDFLKPGLEELCQLLPPALARPLLSYATRKGWLGKFHLGMEVNTTAVSGYLRFLLLAKLKALRPYGYRYAQEQEQIEIWLALVHDAAIMSAEIALEVAECARLVKGYGDTHARGIANFRIIETRVIRPILSGQIDRARAVDAISSARTAALLDPEGEGLARCLAELGAHAAIFRVAAE
jgi:indolepyruvate ferredoxin oxidoreductase beta subunit